LKIERHYMVLHAVLSFGSEYQNKKKTQSASLSMRCNERFHRLFDLVSHLAHSGHDLLI